MHPQLAEMVTDLAHKGIMISLFTNGLFVEQLREILARNVTNFVINYNDPSTYQKYQWETLHSNLKYLTEQGCRVTFSKNFAKQYNKYDYVLEACQEYGIRHIRYDITRPNPNKYNNHYGLTETTEIMETVVEFVKDCVARGIKTGLDCCIPLCYVNKTDRDYLKKESVKFSGICFPSIDIHPDLSASYCLPMRHATVDDITSFSGEQLLFQHFSDLVRDMRYVEASPECQECSDFKIRCQGGCLALKGV